MKEITITTLLLHSCSLLQSITHTHAEKIRMADEEKNCVEEKFLNYVFALFSICCCRFFLSLHSLLSL